MNTSDVADGQELFGEISFMSSSEGSGENLQEKSIDQLMKEREKLLSMLNSPKNESDDDEKSSDSAIFYQPPPPESAKKFSSRPLMKEYDPTPTPPMKKFKRDKNHGANYCPFKTPAYFERSPLGADYDEFMPNSSHFDDVNGHEFETANLDVSNPLDFSADFQSHSIESDDFHTNNMIDFHQNSTGFNRNSNEFQGNSTEFTRNSTDFHQNSNDFQPKLNKSKRNSNKFQQNSIDFASNSADFPTNAVDLLNNSSDFRLNFHDAEQNFQLVTEVNGKNSQTTPVDVDDTATSDYDDDMDEEIYKLLDDELENGLVSMASVLDNDKQSLLKEKFKDLTEPPNIKDKIVMKHRGTEYFEVLPDGWIEVTHSSGIPVYLHKSTRVCTLSRPYFLGPGSVRNHDVPFAAVPCLHQRKIREREALRAQKCQIDTQSENVADDLESAPPTQSQPSSSTALDKLKMPQVKLQTADDFKMRNLTADQLHDYCKNVFEFERIQVMRFKSWSDHRAYHRKNKRDQQQRQHQNAAASSTTSQKKSPNNQQENKIKKAPSSSSSSTAIDAAFDPTMIGRPMLPSNVKLITVPDMEKGSKPQQKQFFLNPQGKTSIAVLHEYVQKVLKGQVSYAFNETRNAANPYMATVKILSLDRQRNGAAALAKDEELWVSAGNGVGNSKKNAKLDAARDALRVLVPGIEFSDDGVAGLNDNKQQDDVTDLFDLIPIVDSRVHELSVKAGQPTPFVILQECLKRHSAFGNTSIEMKIERVKHQQHEFFMKVGKHEVKVMCTNKKEGKQKAAQFMLEKLQPQIKTWGSLIRLYGYGAQRKLQETRKEKDSIIKLQSQNKNQSNEPNTAILDKLRQEMKKLFHSPPDADVTPASLTAGKRKKHSEPCSVKSIDI